MEITIRVTGHLLHGQSKDTTASTTFKITISKKEIIPDESKTDSATNNKDLSARKCTNLSLTKLKSDPKNLAY